MSFRCQTVLDEEDEVDDDQRVVLFCVLDFGFNCDHEFDLQTIVLKRCVITNYLL